MDLQSGGLILKGMTDLMRAASINNANEFVRIAREFDPKFVDEQDSMGWTALHFAAANGCDANICILLEMGASPHCKSKDEKTPREIAIDNAKGKTAELLKDAERKAPLIKKEDMPQRIVDLEGEVKTLKAELASVRELLDKIICPVPGVETTDGQKPQKPVVARTQQPSLKPGGR